MSHEPEPPFTGFSGAAWTHAALIDSPQDLSADRYRVDGELGRGGMGVVFLATDRWLGRQVALKRPRAGVAQSVIDRMVREAGITGRLVHPSIPPVLDVGDDDSGPYYTVPVLHGTPMSRWTPDSTGAWVQAVRDVARALGHAHERGIVHRDVKSDNVLIGEHGQVWVVDWGVAFDAAAPDTAIVGTPGWTAPEQAKGHCSAASDVYALGRLLAVCDPRNALLAIASRAQHSSPDQRYASAHAMADDLDRWLDGQRVLAHRYTASEAFWGAIRRHKARVWTATGAAVLAATGVTGAFWVQASERAQTELALAHGLAARAATASQNGARAEAELLAISALELADSPVARGVLARWAAHPRPQRLAEGLSQCSRGWRSDGTQLCRDGDDLVLHSDAGVVSTHRVPQDPAVPFSEAQLYANALLTRDVVRAWNDGQSTFLAGHPGANYLATGHRAAYIHQNSVYTVDGGTEPRLVAEAVCDRAEGLHTVGEHILVVCHESIVHIDPTEHHTYGVPGQPVLARWAGRVVAVTYQGDVLIRRADAWQVVETNAGPVAEAVVAGENHLIVTTESGVTRVLNTNTGRWLTDLPQGVHAAVPKPGVVRLFGPDGWTDYAGVIQPPMSLDLSVNGGVGDMAWQGEGGLLLIGSADGSSTLWNPATGTTERLGQGSDNVAKAMGWFQGDWMYPADVVRHKDWSAPEGSWFSQVAATDDVAILRGYGGQLYAFDGTALTPISYPEHIRALTATNDQWWVALVSGTVEAFDGSTRTHSLHLTPAPSILAATPEHLAVGVDDHLSLMTLDGQTAWTAQLPDIITSLAVNDAFAVAGLQNGALHILDGQTGEQHAVVTTHKRRVASLLLQNNTLVSGSWDGWVHHFDLSVLDADAAALKTTIEGAWGMTAADIAL